MSSDSSKHKSKLTTERNQKIQELFHQIDLAQARMTKEQEEIDFLAKETDKYLKQLEYLNQLEYKAS